MSGGEGPLISEGVNWNRKDRFFVCKKRRKSRGPRLDEQGRTGCRQGKGRVEDGGALRRKKGKEYTRMCSRNAGSGVERLLLYLGRLRKGKSSPLNRVKSSKGKRSGQKKSRKKHTPTKAQKTLPANIERKPGRSGQAEGARPAD